MTVKGVRHIESPGPEATDRRGMVAPVESEIYAVI